MRGHDAFKLDSNGEEDAGDSPSEANIVDAETTSAASREDDVNGRPVATGDESGPDVVGHLGIGSHLRSWPGHHPKSRYTGLKEQWPCLRNSLEEMAL